MSDKERKDKTKQYDVQNTLLSEKTSSDVIINMDTTTGTKTEVPNNEFDRSKVSTCLPTEQIILTTMNTDKEVDDNTKNTSDNLEKQKVDDNKDYNKKSDIPNIITIRVYETYFGKQQPAELPHQRQPIPRPSLHQQFGSPWGGGNVDDPLSYEPGSRNPFIKFVFMIVFIMLVATSCFIAYVLATDSVRRYMRRNFLLFFLAGLVILLICQYGMTCSPCTRVPPCNIIFLILTVVAFCLMAGALSARYRTELVLYAALATTALTFVCLLLACSKFDFTSWILYVVAIATVFSAISLIIFVGALITRHYPKPLHIAVLIIGSLIQAVILIIELQMILGGKTVELNENDYALGAFMLYTSIMNLFMNLLQLIGYMD